MSGIQVQFNYVPKSLEILIESQLGLSKTPVSVKPGRKLLQSRLSHPIFSTSCFQPGYRNLTSDFPHSVLALPGPDEIRN